MHGISRLLMKWRLQVYNAKVLCDSVSCFKKVRLTTLEVTMPRIVLAEFNTHRKLSRNSASSRAIPVARRISMLQSHPFIPDAFMQNQRGMQAGVELDTIAQDRARQIWMEACAAAIKHAKALADLEVHKQWANRLLEPFAWQTVICSATEWQNFFNLRRHRAAQPEIRKTAELMFDAMQASTPTELDHGEWHIPYITEEDIEESMNNSSSIVDDTWLVKLSVARCARVSYLTHDTNKRDIAADIKLHDMLLTSGHMSPFEHQAKVGTLAELTDHLGTGPTGYMCYVCDGEATGTIGNFDVPWIQYRKTIPNEAIYEEQT